MGNLTRPLITDDEPSKGKGIVLKSDKKQCPHCGKSYVDLDAHIKNKHSPKEPESNIISAPDLDRILTSKNDLIEGVGYWLSSWQGQYAAAKRKKKKFVLPLVDKYERFLKLHEFLRSL